MKNYANKATKELIICIAACVGFARTLLENDFHNKKMAKRHLVAMRDQAQKVLDIMCADFDKDVMAGIMRYADNSEIICVPKTDPRVKKTMYFIEEKDLFRILDESLNCQFCVLDQTGVKNCEVRQALLRSGVSPIGGGGCPYKGAL